MIKKLLSCITLMLFAFCMNTSAQAPQISKFDAGISAKYAALPMTSSLDLKSNEFWWGYWDGSFDNDMRILGVGNGTVVPQKYSACIRIPAGSVIGKGNTVEGLKFTLSDHKNVDNLQIWMSNDLPVNIEDASICCQSIARETITSLMNSSDQWNEVRFDKPYKIDSEKDLYIGYSFVITAVEDQNDKYPLLVDMASTTQENAMFLRFSEPSEWADFNGSQNGDLGIRVLMSGVEEKKSVAISDSFEPVTAVKGSEVTIPVTVNNKGIDGFETLDIVVDVNGVKQTETIKADSKISSINARYNFNLTFNAGDVTGNSDVTITVDKVDGVPNECADNTMKGALTTISREVTKKVVVEEMTALWCGGCPIGYIALQKLRKQFGEDIVLISLHLNDPMKCEDYVDFMQETNDDNYIPTSHVDRYYMDIHPYAGSEKNGRVGKAGFGGFGLGNDCLKIMETLPVAEVNVKGNIAGDKLMATASTKYLFSGDVNHAVAFVVTEDSVHNEKWLQSNYLKDQRGLGWENEEPLFDMWVNGEGKISNVIYDDIAVAANSVSKGIEGSIPASVVEEDAIECSCEFDLTKYSKNIQDRSKLHIIAFVIDRTTGHIVNADCQDVTEGDTGIENIGTENEAAEVARYTLDGRRISTAVKGVNIVKYSDGTVKKVVVE